MNKRLLITFLCSVFGICLYAQDFQPEQGGVAETETVNVSEDEGLKEIEVIQSTTDGSDESVVESNDFVPASKYAEEFLNDRLSLGYDAKKKRIFVSATVAATIEDPAISDDFLVIRGGLYTRAIMQCKAKIAEAFNGKMSARDLLEIPGNDVHAALNKDSQKAQRIAQRSLKEFQKIAADLGVAEADADAGVTFGDRFNNFVDGIIKKVDSNYDPNVIDAKKKAKYEKRKAEYFQAQAEYEKLLEEAKKLKGVVEDKMASTVSIMAEMPLAGASVVQSYESYDEDTEQFEVSVIVGWSKGAEQAAHASLMAIPLITEPKPNKLSLRDWLKTQDWSIIGGSKSYIDENGKRWVLGVAARGLGNGTTADNKARMLAPVLAKKNAQFALLSDIATKKVAESLVQTKSVGLNKSLTEAAESISAKMKQEFEGRDVSGTTVKYSKTLVHPISGREMVVAVAATDIDLCLAAKDIVAESYAISENVKAKSAESNAFKEQLKKGNIPDSARKAVQLTPPQTKKLVPIRSSNVRKGGKAQSGVFGQEASDSDLDDF
ncbi:MAG: hypothetical protein P8P49_00905 [Opitutales bacterium]|nr:hypothetical protein [Opitutales bacterium]